MKTFILHLKNSMDVIAKMDENLSGDKEIVVSDPCRLLLDPKTNNVGIQQMAIWSGQPVVSGIKIRREDYFFAYEAGEEITKIYDSVLQQQRAAKSGIILPK